MTERWRPAPDLAVVRSTSRVVIVNLAHPESPPVILEDTAARMWSLLEQGVNHDDLMDKTISHGITAEEAGAFISALVSHGLLQTVE